jgi:CBS domain-containing protein
MTIGKILSSRSITVVDDEASLYEVSRKMSDDKVGAVLVTCKEKPVGIITDRDLALRCFKDDKALKDLRAVDVMSSPVVYVRPEDGIYKIIETMENSSCRRVVVMDPQDKVIGLLSSGDLLKLLLQELTMLSKVLTPEGNKIARSKVA